MLIFVIGYKDKDIRFIKLDFETSNKNNNDEQIQCLDS